MRLAAGDLLVLEAGPAFSRQPRSGRAFVLATDVPKSSPPKKNRMWLALLLTALMIGSQILAGALKWNDRANLWVVASLTAALMLGAGCLSAEQARGSFDWEVYITIAFAFGISTAMEKTKVRACLRAPGLSFALSKAAPSFAAERQTFFSLSKHLPLSTRPPLSPFHHTQKKRSPERSPSSSPPSPAPSAARPPPSPAPTSSRRSSVSC